MRSWKKRKANMFDRYALLSVEMHEIECQQQPDEFPCNCDEIKDRKQQEWEDSQENEGTGN